MLNGFIGVLVGQEAIPSDIEDQLTILAVSVIRRWSTTNFCWRDGTDGVSDAGVIATFCRRDEPCWFIFSEGEVSPYGVRCRSLLSEVVPLCVVGRAASPPGRSSLPSRSRDRGRGPVLAILDTGLLVVSLPLAGLVCYRQLDRGLWG